MRNRTNVGLLALTLLAACQSERTIATRAHPDGEEIACVGISQKGKQPGIDYDLSVRNTIVGVIFFEMVAPPIMVLHHETFCPIADTTSAPKSTAAAVPHLNLSNGVPVGRVIVPRMDR